MLAFEALAFVEDACEAAEDVVCTTESDETAEVIAEDATDATELETEDCVFDAATLAFFAFFGVTMAM